VAATTVGFTPWQATRPSMQGVRVVLRILVVDDNRHFRRSASELLALRGFELVDTAADGEAAIAAARRACPGGVLLDVNLPGKDGYAVATSLAAACPAARIVLTSSDVDEVPRTVLHECGATAFVPKTELATADLRRLFDWEATGRPSQPGPGGRP
jgi:DNA-binding NarL/FixJ family response regulator